ncbi:ERF family protein [Campylobacter sp. RM16191]|uniref:ERF family protein n=1 Tax=Campylobacter sp. RM16191 TaxID=1705728 RepID=UPI00147478C5|nr:ERF family protein [Campylobacter sp. RM16191]
MNIYEKLVKIQCELKAPKTLYNSFGKYYYRNAEIIYEAVKSLQAQYGVVLLVSDVIKSVGDRIYVEAAATLINAEAPSESVTVTACARETDAKYNKDGKETLDKAQITGAASSYARKYALNGLFAIDDTKDADDTNTHDKDEPKQEVKQPNTNKRPELTIEQLNDLSGLIEATNTDMGKFLNYYKVYELRFVPFEPAKNELIKKLNGMKKAG